LSVEAFGQRYELVREATTASMIEAIVADLAESTPLPGAVTSPVPQRPTPLPVEPVPALRIPAILGSATRSGTWTVPEAIHLLVILGEMVLDFRDAAWTADTVVIHASVTMGSLKLVVPPGTQVENECREILSSSKHPKRGRRGAPPNGLLVIVEGRLFMSEVVVKEGR
jgi:hypothetical protein